MKKWDRYCREWVDVPWWFAWLVWSIAFCLPALIVIVAASHIITMRQDIGLLLWLCGSSLCGALGAGISRYLYRKHCR